eukprot:197093_1
MDDPEHHPLTPGSPIAAASGSDYDIPHLPVFLTPEPTDDLLATPRPLIGFLGCRERHAKIVDDLTELREHATLVSLPDGYLVPPMKTNPPLEECGSRGPKGFDGYQPAGFIKANWMYKHLAEIPSLIVIFFEWADSQGWAAQELAFCDQVSHIRLNARARNISVMAVVIQDSALPDTTSLSDRINTLRKRSGLESSKKSVIILNMRSFQTSLAEFEETALLLSTEFYRSEIRRISRIKDKLTSSQPALFVRHHFKVGVLSEFVNDVSLALKYYQSSYQYLLTTGVEPVQIYEMEEVAYLLNFRICQLQLQSMRFIEAADQFRYHIHNFSAVEGLPEIQFKHCAWMQRQHQLFAEMLEIYASDEAITSSRLLHPGFYYQSAAKHVKLRKKWAEQQMEIAGDIEPITEPQQHYFVGQYNTRRQSHDNETDVLQVAYGMEKAVNHSKDVIDLLKRALDSFKKHHVHTSVSASHHIMSQIGMEYYDTKKYALALEFLSMVTDHYRSDGWRAILSRTLSVMLECVRSLGEKSEEIAISLELMQPNLSIKKSERELIQQRLITAIMNMPHEEDETPDCFDLSAAHPLLACCACFSDPTVEWDRSAEFSLTVTSRFPLFIEFSKMDIHFSDPQYNFSILRQTSVIETEESSSEILSGKLDFDPKQKQRYAKSWEVKHEEHVIQCSEILFHFGYSPNSIMLRVPMPKEDLKKNLTALNCSVKNDALRVLATSSKLTHSVHHASPALVGEFYRIEFRLSSEGDQVEDGVLNLFYRDPVDFYQWDAQASSMSLLTQTGSVPTVGAASQSQSCKATAISVQNMQPNEHSSCVVYAKSAGPAASDVHFQICYRNEATHMDLVINDSFKIVFRHPLQYQVQVMADSITTKVRQGGPTPVNLGETVMLYIDVENISGHRLSLDSIEAQTPEIFQRLDDRKLAIRPAELIPSACYSTLCLGSPMDLGTILLGDMRLRWHRIFESEESDVPPMEVLQTESVTALPPINVVDPEILVEIHRPTGCVLGSPFQISFVITNRTNVVQNISIKLHLRSKPDFFIAGQIDGIAAISPLSSSTFCYKMAALRCGHLDVPPVVFRRADQNILLKHPASYGHIHVMPCERGEIESK